MGMDVYGLNPKIKKGSVKPKKLNWANFNKIGQDRKEIDKYFEEKSKFEEINKGVYFRNNVWWWRPLADYVIRFTKVVSDKDAERWHFNDNHEVNDQDAKMIAQQLEHLISTGHTKKYAEEFELLRKKAEKKNEVVEKELQAFSESVKKKYNQPGWAPIDFPKKEKQQWDRILQKRNSMGNYPFNLENVKEFANFCKFSGGFTIG
jgi:hypothetical protein